MSEFISENPPLEQMYHDFVDHSNDKEDPITITKLLDQMDDVYNDMALRRNKIITKLMETVEKVNINPEEDNLDDTTKKILILDTANKLLGESEKAFATRINMRLKQKETDSATLSGQMAVEILRKIDLSNFSGINKTADIPSLESQENNFLNDKELSNSIMDTECKTDSKDVPMLTEEQKDESI